MDHYPWSAADLLADITDAIQLISPPVGSPAGSLTPPAPARQRPPILHRYGVDFCSVCKYEAAICRCGLEVADAQSGDARGEADLSRRIRAAKR